MAEKTPSSAIAAASGLRVAFSRIRRRLLSVRGDGLTAAQASVLARIATGEASSASALAELEGVRQQSMAATIAALDELGLVRRMPDPGDGRRQLLALTPAGQAAYRGTGEARGEWLTDLLASECTERERQTLLRAAAILDRLARV